METAGQKKGKGGNNFSQFYSAQQRFFLQLMMAYQVPDMLRDADKALTDGKSVVISLYNTNESAVANKVSKAIQEGVDIEDLDFTPRELLADLIERYFPIYQYQEGTDPITKTTTTVRLEDESGNPVINRENQEQKEKLLEMVAGLRLPDNPFDAVVNHFGPSKIAEISGRKKRLEGRKYVARKIKGLPTKKINEHEIKNYQSGAKRVAVISGAASTGISLHSDVKGKNQQRRVFYVLQLSWSADKQMQSFGRVHRSFQKSAPEIKLVQTDLAGQKRLINTTSKRLATLGAISKGGRETLGGGLFDIEDITDQYGESAINWLYGQLEFNVLKRMGLLDAKGNIKESASGNVDSFLNRIMALRVEEQNGFFEQFYDKYKEYVAAAKEKGTFDLGVDRIKAKNIVETNPPETVYKHPGGAETKLIELEGDVEVKRIPFVRAKQYGEFYKNQKSGKVYAVRKEEGNEKSLMNPRGSSHDVDKYNIERLGYEKIKTGDAEAPWTEEYKKISATEKQKYHILSGAVFPIYDKIFGQKSGIKAKIVRATLKNGESYIGIGLDQKVIAGVKQRLGIGAALKDATPADIFDMLGNKSIIELDNGWWLKSARVHGETRFEINTRNAVPNKEEMKMFGAFEEIIDYKRRYFVPTEEELGKEVIAKILKVHSAVKDVTEKDEFGEAMFSKKERPNIRQSTEAYTPSPEEGQLTKAVYRSQGKTPTPGAIRIVEPNAEQERIGELAKDTTGKDVVWMDVDDKQLQRDFGHTFNGFMFRGKTEPELENKIFINTNTDKPALWIAYHEFAHFLQSNPEYSSAFWDAAKLTKKGAEEAGKKGRDQTMADIAGEMMAEPDFWEALNEKNKSLVRVFINKIMEILDHIIKAVTGRKDVDRKSSRLN